MLRSRNAFVVALALIVAPTLYSQEKPRWEVLLDQAGAQTTAGQLEQAEATYKTIIAEQQSSDMPTGLHLAALSLERLYRNQNRVDDLEALYRRILTMEERRFGPLHGRVVHWLMKLGEVLEERGEYDEAEHLALRALVACEAQPRRMTTNIGAALRFLAGVYRAQNRPKDAAVAEQRMIENAQQGVRQSILLFGESHPGVAGTMVMLANTLSETGRHGEAEAQLRRALAVYESAMGTYPELSIQYAAALHQMARLSNALGRDDEARAFQSRADNLRSGAMHWERSANDR